MTDEAPTTVTVPKLLWIRKGIPVFRRSPTESSTADALNSGNQINVSKICIHYCLTITGVLILRTPPMLIRIAKDSEIFCKC